MNKIFLKQLELKNFMSIKHRIIDFSSITNIYGDNGTGKTTVNDAFTWLLFGKDSKDIAKFTVQPLDGNGDIVHNLETEVIGDLDVNDTEMILKKVLKERWVKKRGEIEAELKGTTTDYYINEVPQKEKEFQQKVSEIIPEDIFKLLTNPLYFASVMKWQDRRKIIFDMNGDVSQDQVINYNKKLEGLNKLLNKNESMEDFTKRVKAQIAKLKKDQLNIPARVDECSRNIKDLDYASLELNKAHITADIKNIDEQLADGNKANDEILKKKDEIYQLKNKLQRIEWDEKGKAEQPLKELNSELIETQSKLSSYKNKLTFVKNDIEQINKSIELRETKKAELKKQWYLENSKELHIDENEFICPVCHRAFEAEDIEKKKSEMLSNFKQSVARTLKDITAQGQGLNTEIEALQAKLKTLDIETLENKIKQYEAKCEDIQRQMNEFQPVIDLDSNVEYQEIKKQIEAMQSEIQQPKDTQNDGLKMKKRELQTELDDINRQLNCKQQDEELRQRIAELQAEQKEIAQKIADLEKAQYLSEEFTRTKVELLESSINSKFKLVKIKLFENQVNGGLNDCCEVMVDGVPFSTNLNSGMRINAGLDIINTLSQFYQVQAPIWLDNKESVTKLIDTDSQVVNLIVSEHDKELRIDSLESEVA